MTIPPAAWDCPYRECPCPRAAIVSVECSPIKNTCLTVVAMSATEPGWSTATGGKQEKLPKSCAAADKSWKLKWPSRESALRDADTSCLGTCMAVTPPRPSNRNSFRYCRTGCFMALLKVLQNKQVWWCYFEEKDERCLAG